MLSNIASVLKVALCAAYFLSEMNSVTWGLCEYSGLYSNITCNVVYTLGREFTSELTRQMTGKWVGRIATPTGRAAGFGVSFKSELPKRAESPNFQKLENPCISCIN